MIITLGIILCTLPEFQVLRQANPPLVELLHDQEEKVQGPHMGDLREHVIEVLLCPTHVWQVA